MDLEVFIFKNKINLIFGLITYLTKNYVEILNYSSKGRNLRFGISYEF